MTVALGELERDDGPMQAMVLNKLKGPLVRTRRCASRSRLAVRAARTSAGRFEGAAVLVP
jgi:hypothetical protein